jgi:hypothetical protein
MRRSIAMMFVVLLALPMVAFAERETLCTVDEFLKGYNQCMDMLEYETYYGVDPNISRKTLTIESGDVNDTCIFALPDYTDGFFMLILNKNTENIIGITAMFASRGADKQPARLLEYMTPIAYCSGAISDPNDITTVMYEMGMYSQGAYAQGVSSSYSGERCTIYYESTTISGNELIYAYTE